MHKIVCLALGHRYRLVQEFGPSQRRLKCVRCGGDWGMHDALHVAVDWTPRLQQLYRDLGFEILEPLPAWHSFPMEPLTWGELFRAIRWPGVLAITLSSICGYTFGAADIGNDSFLAGTAISWAIGRFLGQRAIDRAYERKCNTLQA